MAYIQRRGKNQQVYVYTIIDGKLAPLPRHQTSFLDKESHQNQQHWLDNYNATHLQPKRDYGEVIADRDTEALIKAYTDFLAGRKRAKATIDQHELHLRRDVVPYFHGKGCLDLNTWPEVAFDLHDYLVSQGMPPNQIDRANIALRGFWTWLLGRRKVLPTLKLTLLNPPQVAQDTVLPAIVSPNEALAFALFARNSEIRLLTLLGYFFSLRPQETMGLYPRDFVAGAKALELEAGRVMAAHDLYGKLAVRIDRQRTKGGELEPPKAGSKGWVACFNLEAAKLLVATIKDLDPSKLLITSWKPDGTTKAWNKWGLHKEIKLPNGVTEEVLITLKDLRRASLYWLGHNTKMTMSELKNHARHVRGETTFLYTRRPNEDAPDDWRGLDLEA